MRYLIRRAFFAALTARARRPLCVLVLIAIAGVALAPQPARADGDGNDAPLLTTGATNTAFDLTDARLHTAAVMSTAFDLTFQTSGQDLYGDGAPPVADFTMDELVWDGSLSIDQFDRIAGKDFGVGLNTAASGLLRLDGVVERVDPGLLAVTYPATVQLQGPEPNSFAPGDMITVSAPPHTVGSGHELLATLPSGQFHLDARFGFDAVAEVEGCAFDCTSSSWFDISRPAESFEIVDVGQVLSDAGLTQIDSFSSPEEAAIMDLLALEGFMRLPLAVETGASSVVGGDQLEATSGSNQYFDLGFDVGSFSKVPLGVEFPAILSNPLASVGVELEAHLVAITAQGTGAEELRVSFAPNLQIMITLPAETTWTRTGSGSGLGPASGTGATVTFAPGQSVAFTVPAGVTAPFDLQPQFSLANNQMIATFDHVYTYLRNFAWGSFTMKLPGFTVVPRVCVPLIGCTPAVRSPSFDVSAGPLFESDVNVETERDRLSYDFTAPGFPLLSRSFVLDPIDARFLKEASSSTWSRSPESRGASATRFAISNGACARIAGWMTATWTRGAGPGFSRRSAKRSRS